MKKFIENRAARLFVILGGLFVCNVLVAEFVGVKIFSLEDTFGWETFNWKLFTQSGSLQFTAGVIIWPIVFVMTDIINEYFGRRGVRFLSLLTVVLILYAFIAIQAAIHLAPADWWVGTGEPYEVDNMQNSFRAIFGQSSWIIVGSVVAFLIGQIVDAVVFYRIRSITGEGRLYARALVSTLVSQLIDSFVVLYIAFVIGPANWPLSLFFAVAIVNYIYKVIMAIVLTPSLYVWHKWIDSFLGEKLATRLKKEAML